MACCVEFARGGGVLSRYTFVFDLHLKTREKKSMAALIFSTWVCAEYSSPALA